MRIQIFLLTIFIIIIGCSGRPQKKFIMADKTGEWRVDSMVGQKNYYTREWVYIFDNQFWHFQTDTCPIVLDSCLHFQNDSVFKDSKLLYTVSPIDSFQMLLKSVNGSSYIIKNISRRFKFEDDVDFTEVIKEYTKRDSLIKRVIGWWRLKDATFRPVKLINNPDPLEDFTLLLDNNGRAIFYSKHNLDSTVHYSWTTNVDGISFASGCITGSDSKIIDLTDQTMLMIMDDRYYDTLLLERCPPLR